MGRGLWERSWWRGKYHFSLLEERMVFSFVVAFGAVEPFPTWMPVRNRSELKGKRATYSMGI
jgi:hypothetical protein